MTPAAIYPIPFKLWSSLPAVHTVISGLVVDDAVSSSIASHLLFIMAGPTVPLQHDGLESQHDQEQGIPLFGGICPKKIYSNGEDGQGIVRYPATVFVKLAPFIFASFFANYL